MLASTGESSEYCRTFIFKGMAFDTYVIYNHM